MLFLAIFSFFTLTGVSTSVHIDSYALRWLYCTTINSKGHKHAKRQSD